MKYLKIIYFLSICTLGFSQSPPEIVVSGNQSYCLGSSIPIVNSVRITDPDIIDNTLDEITVQISEGYVQGFDILSLTGVHANITPNWLPNLGLLELIGPATFSEFEAAILAVEFSTSEINPTENRSISINLGDANFLPSTGHYYFYVPSQGINWNTARSEAASQTYFGLQGYLATITSIEEAQFSGEQAQGTGWIGASDSASEGVWQWETGPEAGQVFWNGAANGSSPNGMFSFWNTGEPNNLGDEDYAHITDPDIGIPGSWNDLAVTGSTDPTSPYHPQGYIVEFGGLPGDPLINLSAAITIIMPQTIISDEVTCAGEQLTLTVNSNTDEIIWYDGPTSNTIENTGSTFDVTLNTTTTYWIVSRFMGCTTNDRMPLTVTVNPLPVANSIVIEQCDDDINDGISLFNLGDFSGDISNNTSTNIVTYYEDAQLTMVISDQSYTNLSNNQIVFAKVLNPSTNCFNVAQVTLIVNSNTVNILNNESECEDIISTGIATFDLLALGDSILQNYTPTAQVSFFNTIEDALLNIDSLPDLYKNLNANTETIFVKISDANSCLSLDQIDLIVNPLPQLLPDDSIFYCLDTFPGEISIDAGIINGLPSDYTYSWQPSGEITYEIKINQPDMYIVEVTDAKGCKNYRTIIVEASSKVSTPIAIDVTGDLDNNVVTINAIGQGDYQYAIDSEDGPFQDSNIFENIKSGIRRVYVKDKNGCGLESQDFSVIGYPKFFTPNGDGINDYWQILGLTTQFQPNTIIYIFDRYGKLLKQLNPLGLGWDGTYNGNLMPTDDYWFSVMLQDGRRFTKHFTLKR